MAGGGKGGKGEKDKWREKAKHNVLRNIRISELGLALRRKDNEVDLPCCECFEIVFG